MIYEIIEHQDFYEVQQDSKSVLVADRHEKALTFLTEAVAALNATEARANG